MLKSASQVTFLEGKPSDETLLVGLLKGNVWGLRNLVSLGVGSECVSERQVLVLPSALVSLAHHIGKVNFLSWQVLDSIYITVCSVSTGKDYKHCSSEHYFAVPQQART